MYEVLYDPVNLYKSYLECRKGKRWKNATNKYAINAMEHVLYTSYLLQTKKYKPGRYFEHTIYEPKERLIKSIGFERKVVQRCLCDYILEPIFERHFIYDNYASRKGKGTDGGIRRTKEFMRKQYAQNGIENCWVLKCDIEKYYDSVDHEILKQIIRKLIPDQDIIDLLDMIIDSVPNPGLPIGNQTSQLLSLIYLSAFDHYIKEVLQIKYYIRYMDDFVLFHHNKEYLRYCKQEIKRKLSELKLELNEKSHIFPLKNGVDFLGFHFYLTESGKIIMKVRRESKERMRRKLVKFKELYDADSITIEEIEQSFESWSAHARRGNAHHLIQTMGQKYDKIFEEVENG